jgi:hypothetical protein
MTVAHALASWHQTLICLMSPPPLHHPCDTSSLMANGRAPQNCVQSHTFPSVPVLARTLHSNMAALAEEPVRGSRGDSMQSCMLRLHARRTEAGRQADPKNCAASEQALPALSYRANPRPA